MISPSSLRPVARQSQRLRPAFVAVRRVLALTVLVFPAGHAAAEPQDAPSGREVVLGEVIVTAQRRAESLQEVPIAITAVDGGALVERGLQNLQDLSGIVPSLNVQNRRASGVVTIRGIGFEVATAGADPAVAVHTDGVYTARPAAALNSFFDVDRVEVSRGPQGTLYGRNATGGAINIVTRKPTAETEGYLDASIGNYSAIAAEGAVGGSLGSDRLLGRIAFKHSQHDGYGRNRFLNTDVNDWDASAVRGQLQWLPTDSFSLLISADYFIQDDNAFTPTFGGFAVPCRTDPPFRRCGTVYGGEALQHPQDVLYDYETINDRESVGVAVTAEWELNGLTLRSITGFRNTNYVWEVDGDMTTFDIGFVGRDEDADQLSQELQLIGETGNLKWLVGGFYFTEDNDALGYADIPVPDFRTLIIRQFGNLETDAWALFGQATYRFSDLFSLTLGGRYSSEEKSIVDESSQQLPGVIPPPQPTRSKEWSDFSPKVTLEFNLAAEALIYVSAQDGFKSGGYAAGARTPPFDPEEVRSYEVGFKGTWADSRLRANIALFQYDYEDLQVGFVQNIPGGAVITVVTNAAAASNTGIELELLAQPTDALTLEFNTSWMNARFDEYLTVDPNQPSAGELDLSGNTLAQAPDFTGFLAAEYEWAVGSGSMSLRGEYNYTSTVYFDAYNREGSMSQDAYGLANLFLTYDSGGKWRISAFARNLFDEEYNVGGAIAGAIWGSPVLTIPGSPATYGLRASMSF